MIRRYPVSYAVGCAGGFVIGYIGALVVDIIVIVYGCKKLGGVATKSCKTVGKTVGRIATKTKIPTPSPQILFERTVDAIWEAY